ncbi:hypothetical protein ABIE13_004042 [Ottowia thiooxydans]|uniref:Uncharacterized protein n=1 Tax=Ottowia thiooxydans TaxID=219182 RepID=A0ABV2QD08_9BURK
MSFLQAFGALPVAAKLSALSVRSGSLARHWPASLPCVGPLRHNESRT